MGDFLLDTGKMMLSKGEEVSVDVNKDDQDRINRFSCQNTVLHELEERLLAKKEQGEALDDATMALYEAEDDEVPIMVGEAMMILPKDEAIEKVEKMSEQVNNECSEIESQINDI